MTNARALRLRVALLVGSVGAALLGSSEAMAQRGGAPSQGPTQSAPTRNLQVGPQRGGSPDDEASGPSASSPSAQPTGEPTAQAPADPLAMPEDVRDRIGTDHDERPPSPQGSLHQSFFPVYEERRGDYRLRLLPPFFFEHTRGVDSNGASTDKTDTERLSALLFYQRRSPNKDADVLFPLAWRVRDRQNHVLVLGPLVHREAPNEHDNWLAPLYFQGSREHGGYFHAPPLLTTSHWDDKGAFTIVGLYYRDRTASDVDWGIVPFVFRGDNGNEDGARKKYTLIPPLLFYNRWRENDESRITVVGPVISESNPKRSVFDVAPLFFSITGRPDTGGVKEAHYTLFPLFHYGNKPDQSLFVLPGYLRRVTKTTDTLLTPFFSHATTRSGATSLTVAGPILPIYYRATDTDIDYKATGIFPFYYGSSSPTGTALATPLFARFESYNVSHTYWAFPTIVYAHDIKGWEVDVHPIMYVGRREQSTHTVLAPIFWDFASPTGRTTIGFPVYWRFSETIDDSVTQVAGNTLYRQKRVSGGLDWEFHFLPLFSYGQNPAGYFWNVLFGLAGYTRNGETATARALWVPFTVAGGTTRTASVTP
ncbi:MAG: hypothetical protein FWD73_06255 [Polyangiaceae bacterium]|nr:hypothetical protein [Polyangiaceae bacterium]